MLYLYHIIPSAMDIIITISQTRKLRLREKQKGEGICCLSLSGSKGHDSISSLPGSGEQGSNWPRVRREGEVTALGW